MARLIIQLLLTVSCLASLDSATARAGEPSCGGKLVANTYYLPAIEMQDAYGRSALILGMNHGGTAAYYQRANAELIRWVGASVEPTVIMKEFGHCDSQVEDIDPSSIKEENIEKIATLMNGASFAELARQPETVAKVLTLFGSKPKVCHLDIDGLTLRPPYLVDRNREACAAAALTPGQACQWAALHYPSGKNIRAVEADLAFDESPALQLAGIFMYRGIPQVRPETVRQIAPFIYSAIMDYRAEVVEARVRSELAKGARRVVLPWGASHATDFHALLSRLGFKVTSVRDIKWAEAAEIEAMPDLKRVMQDPSCSSKYSFEL